MTWTSTTLLLLALLSLFYSFVLSGETGDGWSYHEPNGPNTWSKNYPKCGGKEQSPVDIIPIKVNYDGMEDLEIQYPNDTALNLSNNGKAIHGEVVSNEPFTVAGAGLDVIADFRLKDIHFHVGSRNSLGSEHRISGKAFPMEMQLVHYDIKRRSSRPLVLSVLFSRKNDDNVAMNGIINKLQNCSYKGDSVLIPSLSVRSVLPKDTAQFYRYSGSLTTPQCNESDWILFHKTASISERQLKAFREVYRDTRQKNNSGHLVDNFRPIQLLNGRIVKRNFDHPQFKCGKKSDSTADCRQIINGNDVFYEVEVQPCTLPVTFNFKISVPVLGFEFSKTLFQDQKTPIPIANLSYGASTEMHFHSKGLKAGQLHITIYLNLLSGSQTSKVIEEYFQVENVCQRANCSVDSWDKHWCTSTIGYKEDSLLIGLSSLITDQCASAGMMVKIYRRASAGTKKYKWIMTAVNSFVDKQSYNANLTGSIVIKEDRSVVRSRRDVAVTTKWSVVTLEAYIVQNSYQSVNFMLFLQIKQNGGHYLIFNETYIYPRNYCSRTKPGSSTGRNVAIGVSVVLVMLVLIGTVGVLLYRNRKAYFGHRPALVDEIDIQDADRL